MILPAGRKLNTTYSTIETPPIASVETLGVRKRGWILAKAFGIALYAAIASDVRAVGRIVVCVDAAADVSTISTSSLEKNKPAPCEPNAALPRMLMTSLELAVLGSPFPVAPTPANPTTAIATTV